MDPQQSSSRRGLEHPQPAWTGSIMAADSTEIWTSCQVHLQSDLQLILLGWREAAGDVDHLLHQRRLSPLSMMQPPIQ